MRAMVQLREKYFDNKVFDRLERPEDQLADGLRALKFDSETVKSIAVWDWRNHAISNGKLHKLNFRRR